MEFSPQLSEIGAIPWPDDDVSLVARFEQVAAGFGARPALVHPGGTVSYDELSRAANRVAHQLLSLQQKEGAPVALLPDDPAVYLPALLGALKAGKFYLPLDPSFPPERTAYILQDSRSGLLLTDAGHLERARQLAGADIRVFCLDDMAADLPETNPGLAFLPSAPSVLLYTSGSTGRPKGVLHSHRSLVHNALRQNDLMRITSTDRVSMLYSPSVMGLVRDLFNALLNGASLHPFNLPQQGLRGLIPWVAERRLTVLHTISSVFRRLGDVLEDPAPLETVRLLILGGEEVLRMDVDLYKRFFPAHSRFFTGLGSSEAGTVRASLLDKESVIETSVIPVGYPVRDVEITLLGEDGRPAPPGEVGEIAVRSKYLAIGYWNQPERNASSFLPDPEGGEARTFLTGDLGRLLPSGALAHSGRKDFQVKIRGFRIELLEVEAAILETSLVADVAVMVYDRGSGDKRLVAFVEPRPGGRVRAGELRAALGSRLPDHMIPSLFIELASIPKTANGKVDRNALPEPDFTEPASAGDLPRDDSEGALLELWKETLSLPAAGIHDNFFDLGGDSLLAGTLLARVEKEFGRLYPLSLLAEYGTVEKMARVLRDPNSGLVRSLVAIKPTGDRLPLFVVPGGYGDTLYLRHLARELHPAQPLYGLQAGGLDGRREYLPSVEEIAAFYVSEVRSVQPSGPYLVAGHSFGGYVALEMGRQLLESGEEVGLVALLDTYPPGQRREASWRDRLSIHLDNLRGRTFRAKLDYFRERFLSRLPLLARNPRLASWLGLAQLGPGNRFLISRMARYRYSPAPYPGRSVLIRALRRHWYIKWDPMDAWPSFVGDLEVRDVDGEHATIMFEPSVAQLAAILDEAIHRAQARD
jgi:amino acid adenylation domain-containing protein